MSALFCNYCRQPATPWRELRDSVERVVIYCSSCARPALGGNSYIPLQRYTEAELRRMPSRIVAGEQCGVCKADRRLETHHLAPRHLFGAEADLWPTVRVCRECHERWHRKVDGSIDRWHAARARKAEETREKARVRRAWPWAEEERAKLESLRKGGRA